MSSPEPGPEAAPVPSASGGRGLVGLRIDACTFEGCRDGLPAVLDVLARRSLRATVFPAMGPDRSGLAVLRVFRKKGFLGKMVRTGAASMYGIRTALYGTLLPAPVISARCREVIARAAAEGHELGIHGWDHVLWQDGLDGLSEDRIRDDYRRAIDAHAAIAGRPPECTGSPAWIASERSLLVEEGLGFRFASDCRGRTPFRPLAGGRVLSLPQVPITLPTLDEVLGRDGRTPEAYNDYILGALGPGSFNVHTAHAEAEGRRYRRYFEELLDRMAAAGWTIVPLGGLLDAWRDALSACPLERGFVEGRAGEVSIQGEAVEAPGAP